MSVYSEIDVWNGVNISGLGTGIPRISGGYPPERFTKFGPGHPPESGFWVSVSRFILCTGLAQAVRAVDDEPWLHVRQ